MMNSIVKEKQESFKALEQKNFAYVCELGREITRIMLESYDKELSEERDKKVYRSKGSRKTTIKTVYGEVEYRRRVYQTKTPNRQSGGIDGGLAEKIVALIREDESITVLEMSKTLETPKRTIEREMKKLRNIKRITREGGNRYGHWKIND